MIVIKKTGEGYYLASITGHKENLGRNECYILKKEIVEFLKPHRDIAISIKGVQTIDKGGFNIFRELKNIADMKKCNLRFINVESVLASKILSLSKKKTQTSKEIE